MTGADVKHWREARGWTANELAEKLGMTRRGVDKLEARPTVRRVYGLALWALEWGAGA